MKKDMEQDAITTKQQRQAQTAHDTTSTAHPGVVLTQVIGAMGMEKMAFADAAAIPRATLSRIIQGTRGIPQAIAFKLEGLTAVPAENWLCQQVRYEVAKAREHSNGKGEPQ